MIIGNLLLHGEFVRLMNTGQSFVGSVTSVRVFQGLRRLVLYPTEQRASVHTVLVTGLTWMTGRRHAERRRAMTTSHHFGHRLPCVTQTESRLVRSLTRPCGVWQAKQNAGPY